MEDIGERIKNKRKALGLTQQQLADKIGLSRVAVTKWESGQTENLKLKNLMALCDLFRIEAKYLVFGEPPIGKLNVIQDNSKNHEYNNNHVWLDLNLIDPELKELIYQLLEIDRNHLPQIKAIIQSFKNTGENNDEREKNAR